MFSSKGYFSTVQCPFFLFGLCERPNCHFNHQKVNSREELPISFTETPTSLQKLVDNAVEKALLQTNKASQSESAELTTKSYKGHKITKEQRLFLPPKNAPIYEPTPKRLLLSYSPRKSVTNSKPNSPILPVHSKEVLGDICDMSESDEEDNHDLVGSILLSGSKSGVLSQSSNEFEHRLLKEKLKVKKDSNLKIKSEQISHKKNKLLTKEKEENVLKESKKKEESDEKKSGNRDFKKSNRESHKEEKHRSHKKSKREKSKKSSDRKISSDGFDFIDKSQNLKNTHEPENEMICFFLKAMDKLDEQNNKEIIKSSKENEYLISDSDVSRSYPPSEDEYFEDELANEDDDLRRIFEEHEKELLLKIGSENNDDTRKEETFKNKESSDEPTTSSKKRTAHKSMSDAKPMARSRPVSVVTQMLNRYSKIQKERTNHDIENALASFDGGSTTELPKSTVRKAKVPTKVPVVTPKPDMSSSSKVPLSIRQRYLNSILEECLKIYGKNASLANSRAIKEEKECCDKAKTRALYLNIIVNCIKKLRREASTTSSQLSNSLIKPKPNAILSHENILYGNGSKLGTWSREKYYDNSQTVDEISAYLILKRYVLSRESLAENSYPIADPDIKGKVSITDNFYCNKQPQPKDPFKRRCDRCSTVYSVNARGRQTEKDECIFHWGRFCRQRSNRAQGPMSGYYCCKGDSGSQGCEVSTAHVTDTIDYDILRGFVTSLEPSTPSSTHKVFALDCEMCYTTLGSELTRVTVVNFDGKTVYETFVKPDNDIVDYNTRFSGISPGDLDTITTTLRDVQAVLLSMFSSETILIGHSLESDLKALRFVHGTVVDTSVVYPHRLGPPYKVALRMLAADHLKRIIQNDVGGHDSAEDALAALDLMKVKIKEDMKKLKQEAMKKVNS